MCKILVCASLATFVICGTLANHSHLWNDCRAPSLDQVTNFAWNQSEKASGGYYFPMSSAGDQEIEIGMLGSRSANCVRMDWSDDKVAVVFFYSLGGSKKAYFSCEQVHAPKYVFECKHLRAEGEYPDLSHTAWVTLSDNHTYSFTVRCFHHTKQQGWVVFSTRKHLSRHLTDKILHHAKSLGYSTHHGKDYIVRSYDDSTCPQVCLV